MREVWGMPRPKSGRTLVSVHFRYCVLAGVVADDDTT